MMPRFLEAVLTCGLLLQGSTVHAWDATGHAIVATLAEQRLTPQTRAAVLTLLEGQSLVAVASWPDQVRNKQTAPWHYVNIEIEEGQYKPDRHCPNRQCVLGQIERFRETLRNAQASLEKRQKALKYLIHFVGDLHQPCMPVKSRSWRERCEGGISRGDDESLYQEALEPPSGLGPWIAGPLRRRHTSGCRAAKRLARETRGTHTRSGVGGRLGDGVA